MSIKTPVEAMRRQARDSCDTCASQSLCLPAGLDEHRSSELGQHVLWRHALLRGEHLYRVGDPVRDHLYAVKTGQFKIYDVDENGRTRVIGFRRSGDFLGMDVLGCLHHRTNVVALTDAVLCQFSLSRLLVGALRNEALGRQLNCLMSRELAREHEVHLALYERDATSKLSQFLLMQRDEQILRGEPGDSLDLAMSRADIGHYLSLTGETVSRILTRLQLSGCLKISHRQVQIIDISGLHTAPQDAAAWSKMARSPGRAAAGAVREPVAFVSHLPTIAEAATVASPPWRPLPKERVAARKITA